MTASRAVITAAVLCAACYGGYAATFGSPYTLRVLSMAGVFAVASLGYQFIFGHAGALALSQGTFMGLGAYVSAILGARYGVPFDQSLGPAIAAPVLLAAVLAVPVLRLQTHYFALATLIVGQILFLTATRLEGLTGGANGLANFQDFSIFGVPVQAGRPRVAVIWTVVLLGALLLWLLTRGRLGHRFALLRTHPAAAGSVGIDIAGLRLAAFLLSAGYAGAAGALYVQTSGVVSPDVLGLSPMITLLTIAVVGGRTRVTGTLAAAVLVIELPEWVRPLRETYLLAYGCILLLVVTTMPDGVFAASERLLRRFGLPDDTLQVPSCPLPAALAPARPHSRAPLLDLQAVSRRFAGVLALNDVSLTVRAGEIVGLIGPNGSGKTTLLNVVCGLYPADAGRVAFDGREITRSMQHRIARVGLARTFQAPALVDTLSAYDNVALAAAKSRHARGAAAGLLAFMGVSESAGQRCGALPPGIRRLVEIARALATTPRLVLLDEPAAGLNETEQVALAHRLRQIAADGTALVVVEHSMGFLAPLCDRLVCLDAGQVIADGPPAQVCADDRVIEAYLGRALD